ncbi:nuclear transport factor 2 family protein [Pseudonocardia xinjiangensis]|uniref:nuclear transport factor 2 family protein n=1 Tax=Pseudonocardia xinjiangensis TaxID=75289 RepID=UPI003D94596F
MNESEQNKALVLRFYEDLSEGKVESALDCLGDDLEYLIGGHPESFPLAGKHSKSELVNVLGAIGTAIPAGVHVDIFSAIAEGSRVIVEFTARGVSATGKNYDNRVAFSCQVRDGKIRTVREYLDTLHANEVLMEPLR